MELKSALKEVCIQAELGDRKAIDIIDLIVKLSVETLSQKSKESIKQYIFGSGN